MNIFKILLIALLISISFDFAFSANDTVKCKATNFEIINSGTLFRFDIYVLRQTPDNFVMGNTTFFFNYANGVFLTNSITLTNINPKYSSNSSYLPMLAYNPANTFLGLQILHITGQPGEVITSSPGPTGFGERVATINVTIVPPPRPAGLVWNRDESGFVSPSFAAATGDYDGEYNGILPVELSSFTSAVNRNNVKLNWVTASEINNSGFEVERKINGENGTWSKVGYVEGNGSTSEAKSYAFGDANLNAGTYSYRLKQIDFNGNHEYFGLQNDVEIGVPVKFELSQNYPNPFNPATKINFSIPTDGNVSLNIYDVSGRLITSLINNEFRTANYYTIDFNASNLSSGTYLYTVRAGSNVETKKMVLIK